MNTAEFLSKVRDCVQLPDTDEDFTNEVILGIATDCLFERFVNPIVNTRSGYWLYKQDQLTTANMPFYRIHPRAVVQGLELFATAPPDTGINTPWWELSYLSASEAMDIQDQQFGSEPHWFSLESDGLVLYPTPTDVRPLQMKFYLRPPALVEKPDWGGIIQFTQSTVAYSDPTNSSLNDTQAGNQVDIVCTDGSGEAIAINCKITNRAANTPSMNTTTLTFNPPLTDLQYAKMQAMASVQAFGKPKQAVMVKDTSWWVPLPVEMQSSLVTFTSAVVLVDKGDATKAAQMVSRCESSLAKIIDTMTPRVKDRPKVFKTKNTYLRRRAGWRYGYGNR